MKKIMALVLALVWVLGLVGCNSKSMNYIIENKPSVTGIVEEVHDDYIIVYSETADGYPNGSNWSIPLNVENKDSYTNVVVGDEIVFYYDGMAMETDPLRVSKVYAITLKTPANRTQFDIAVSYANWTEESEIYFGSLNKEKMAISSVQHLPIYKFDTMEDLEQFKLTFGEALAMDYGYDEIPPFNDAVAKYDDTFFEEKSIMLVYVGANSGTYRFGVNCVVCDGNSFCIHVEQTNNPEVVTEDMAGWFVTVAVPDSMVLNCTEFDADLNNIEN